MDVLTKNMVCAMWRGTELFRLYEALGWNSDDERLPEVVEDVRSTPDALVWGSYTALVDWPTALRAAVQHSGETARAWDAAMQFASGNGRNGQWDVDKAEAADPWTFIPTPEQVENARSYWGKTPPPKEEPKGGYAEGGYIAPDVRHVDAPRETMKLRPLLVANLVSKMRSELEGITRIDIELIRAARGVDPGVLREALDNFTADGKWQVMRDRHDTRYLRRMHGPEGFYSGGYSYTISEAGDWLAEMVHRAGNGIVVEEASMVSNLGLAPDVVRLAAKSVCQRDGFYMVRKDHEDRLHWSPVAKGEHQLKVSDERSEEGKKREDFTRNVTTAHAGFPRPLSPLALSLVNIVKIAPHRRVSLARLREMRPDFSDQQMDYALAELRHCDLVEFSKYEDEDCVSYREETHA